MPPPIALFYPEGAVYRLRPQPPVRPDPDDPRDQVSCPSAVVLEVEAERLRLRDYPEVVEEVLRMRAAGQDDPQVRRALWALRQVGVPSPSKTTAVASRDARRGFRDCRATAADGGAC